MFCVFLSGAGIDGAEPARCRLEEHPGARSRHADQPYELEIDPRAVAFRTGRHADAEALLNDGAVRIMEAREDHAAEAAAGSG